ncbi:hypothetical protein [Paenibacillus sp. HJGM_3]|uniref:hypothetical protein n=1 Tax=Paenibacillus sp. HJGM_3 TaxID=3379816 RepID=UPI003858AF3A
MITVNRTGKYISEILYNRNKDAKVLNVEVKMDGIGLTHEISVPEAKALAKELMEWVHEFEGDEEETA